jgi:hypothetical protein
MLRLTIEKNIIVWASLLPRRSGIHEVKKGLICGVEIR